MSYQGDNDLIEKNQPTEDGDELTGEEILAIALVATVIALVLIIFTTVFGGYHLL